MATGTGKGRIKHESIEQVQQRADLVELVAGYTQLHRRGAEHSGRCPFHEERTPSFWVNPTKGVYHCFGCGASGDAINFLMAKQGLDFVEAVEALADRYRIQLEYEDGGAGAGKRRSKRRLYEASDAAAAFYEAYLLRSSEAAPVRDYLAARHVTEETARAFRLGYAPEGGNVLARKAMAKGFSREELTDARLLTSHGRDFFRGRLMVPIIDKASRVIGFGARKLREEQFGGKYVNSSDGPLFHKKQVVFYAPGAADAARDAGSIIVVEGYMDVIAMWQAGFRNACAVMGTSLTEEQVVELKRMAPRALFAFDPDAAGKVATLRALDQARAHELDVRVVLLPEGEDPADVLFSGGGRDRMQQLLDDGVSLLHYRTSTLLGSGDLGDASDRDRIYQQSIRLFGEVPDGPARREQVVRVANALQLDSQAADALYDATGAKAQMRLSRPGAREPRFREQRSVRQRVTTTGPRSVALNREFWLLAAALELASASPGVDLDALLPPEDAFLLQVHRRARGVLASGGAAALAPATVRDDEELFALVARMAAPDDVPTLRAVWEHDTPLAQRVELLARDVEMQFLERRATELKGRLGSAAEPDDDALAELARIGARRRELDPRRSGEPEAPEAGTP